MARSFPNDPDKRLDGYLMSKLSGYLSSHTLRLKLLDADTAEEARDLVTGRGKGGIGGGGGGGKKGGMGGIIAAAMMMKGRTTKNILQFDILNIKKKHYTFCIK